MCLTMLAGHAQDLHAPSFLPAFVTPPSLLEHGLETRGFGKVGGVMPIKVLWNEHSSCLRKKHLLGEKKTEKGRGAKTAKRARGATTPEGGKVTLGKMT